MVAGAAAVWFEATSALNPNPPTESISTTSVCEAGPSCPGFQITSARITSVSLPDVSSQTVQLGIKATGAGPMSKVVVLLDNVSMGTVVGPFEAGVNRVVTLGVPTTMTVEKGKSYTIVVEGVYPGGMGGQAELDYWDSVAVVAG